tara:strand:+ start:567 stop:737 length:171 start_codon:yes stop_codon:yes gene_type:complete
MVGEVHGERDNILDFFAGAASVGGYSGYIPLSNSPVRRDRRWKTDWTITSIVIFPI